MRSYIVLLYALLLSIVTKHYKLILLDRKLLLCDNYPDVQAVFFNIKYKESAIRYHTSSKYIQYNDRRRKAEKYTMIYKTKHRKLTSKQQ